ncbi:MAG: response regulator [Proteobacteria bacterium]|nr:response regulator [Pseudomonadota bacterium]MBU1708567.1 response regulator [Pseudomonadota bacterium]
MARILVVDDEVPFRKALCKMLLNAGFDVDEAADGSEAIKIYRQHPADLVIMDIVMPEKEGIETIIELRRDYPDIKIIAISGGGEYGHPEGYLAVAKKLGVLKTFAKPFEYKAFIDAVKAALNPC